MGDGRDTLRRYLVLLRHLPRKRTGITASQLRDKLANEGFEVTLRTVQRDLEKLSAVFRICSDEGSKPRYWWWDENAPRLDIPQMTPAEALAFHVLAAYLGHVLPPQITKDLAGYFQEAERVLDALDAGPGAWRHKVRVLARGPRFLLPEVEESVREAVHEALLRRRRLRFSYRKRMREEWRMHEADPLGLVVRDGLFYLVARVGDHEHPALFVLHRIGEAEVLPDPVCVPEGFDLDAFIAAGELDFVVKTKHLRLEALFTKEAAFHLTERQLAPDQKLIPARRRGWMRLRATVPDTMELRWWLLGFGDQVEVLRPKSLRQEIAETVLGMAELYVGE